MESKWVLAILLCASIGAAQAKNCKDSTTFGAWLNGDTVAHNPDGEEYAADSGSNVQLGCTWFLDKSFRYTSNFSVGYRRQLDKSGKGESSGWSLQTSLGADLGGLTLGGGGLFQFKGRVRDYLGEKTKIEPSLGGFIYIGLSLGQGLELQLRRHYLSLESESGVEYEPAEYGVFLHRAF